MAQTLEREADNLDRTTQPPVMERPAAPAEHTTEDRQSPSQSPRRRGRWVFLIAAVLVIAGGSIGGLTRSITNPPMTPRSKAISISSAPGSAERLPISIRAFKTTSRSKPARCCWNSTRATTKRSCNTPKRISRRASPKPIRPR